MQNNIKIPVLQFRNNTLIGYEQYMYSGGLKRYSTMFQDNALKLLSRDKYSGMMTDGARKRLTKAISLLLQCSKTVNVWNAQSQKWQSHKLSFITLTLPNVEKSKSAKWTHKNLLERMLRVLRRRYNMRMYVWKSELQKNGSVHYHITSDCFIEFSKLREEWNNILNRYGMLEDFRTVHGHSNPNSVDVKKVKKLKDLENYLLKYVAKEMQNQISIKAKVWDCSRNLKEGKYFATEACGFIMNKLNELIEQGKIEYKALEFCTIYRFTHSNLHYYFRDYIKKEYYEHINKIRNYYHEKTETTQDLRAITIRDSLF